jgi:hypothetical protein
MARAAEDVESAVATAGDLGVAVEALTQAAGKAHATIAGHLQAR